MYAVIDLETTGGSAAKDRITEIAVVIHDGTQIVREFSSLINPERPIPGYITDITGITDDMVASAPRFYEIARDIVEMTEGCTFVAHNVNFDYGFLREEFQRLAYTYDRERLCTVRLSRQLIPGLPSYSLGRLCQHLGIVIHARHRAKGDADATVLLLEHLMTLQPRLARPAGRSAVAKDPFAGLPGHIDRRSLSRLPVGAGLYFLHDAGGAVLHVGASRDIRQSALKELQQLMKAPAKAQVNIEAVCDLTWELTGNELLAELRLEVERARLLGASPAARATGKYGVLAYMDGRGYLRTYVDKLGKGKAGHGQFATEADARAALAARLRRHDLCLILGGIEAGSGPCEAHASGQGCAGACLGSESPDTYNARLEAALRGLGYPHPAFFLLADGRSDDEVAVIGIEHGELLGFAFLDAGQGWEDPQAVKGMLKPLPNTESAKQTLRNYLAKHQRSNLVPF